MQTQQQIANSSPIGRDTPRVDGPLKVTGLAQYTSDFHFPELLYAVPIGATIANGRVTGVDAAAAEKMPGVRAILHRANIGKLFRSALEENFEGICEERRPPFADDVVRYYGQYVALAVAELTNVLYAMYRAETQSGADYYLAPRGAEANDLESLIRLEVSGMDRATPQTIAARLAQKLQQLQDGKSNTPGIASIVAFDQPIVVSADLL